MKRRMLVIILLLLPIFGCESIEKKADRATYQAVGKEYVEYVKVDAKLSPEQKERRHRTIYSWGYRGGYDVSFVPYAPGGKPK